jgi:hypothetical protein
VLLYRWRIKWKNGVCTKVDSSQFERVYGKKQYRGYKEKKELIEGLKKIKLEEMNNLISPFKIIFKFWEIINIKKITW